MKLNGMVKSSLSPMGGALVLMAMVLGVAHAQLRGHGGPVRALAVSADGKSAISGSFDTSAIVWSLTRNAAMHVLRFHDAAVNAVAYLTDGRIVTAGADAQIAIWPPDREKPDRVLNGHSGPIVSVAVSPDGKTLASASWDHTVRLWPLTGGAPRVLEGNAMNVNGVAFTPDGKAVVSAGYDASIRIWSLQGAGDVVRNLPTPLNAVAIAPDGEIVAAGADGAVYFLSLDGKMTARVAVASAPIVAIAISATGKLIAAADARDRVAVIDRESRQLARMLVGSGMPVWSLAFHPDGHTLLTGGADHAIRRWNAATGKPLDSNLVGSARQDPLAAYAGDHGAEVFRACVACHTLSPDEGNKAGPSLAGIFGRKIATLRGYHYSEALTHLNIIWTPETVAKMFEVGPRAYTPGTKMPEQKIGSAEDRKALVDFLAKATTKK
jgi:cytochrome c